MAHLGTLRDYHFSSDIEDVRGAVVYGSKDEKLGTIDDVIFDCATGMVCYAIVETGGWLQSRKFVVPAGHIEPRADEENEFQAGLSKDQIEHLPVYREELVENDEDWKRYEDLYQASLGANYDWQAGSSAAQPPPTVDHESAGKSAVLDQSPRGLDELRSPKGTPPEIASAKTTAALRRRWEIFQENLQSNREDILLNQTGKSASGEKKYGRGREVA